MDEHEMTNGVIPLRHSSLPGLVKLPRRYEKAALGDPRTAKHRKVSICSGPLQLGETVSERMDDLLMALLWVKQELILLRQHDILLKHQFINIHDSIRSLQLKENNITSSELLKNSLTTLSVLTMNGDIQNHSSSTGSQSPSSPQPPTSTNCADTDLNILSNNTDYQLETFMVRPSASVKVLNSQNDSSSDCDDEDSFFEKIITDLGHHPCERHETWPPWREDGAVKN